MRDGRLVRHCASTVEARDDLSHTKTRRVTLHADDRYLGADVRSETESQSSRAEVRAHAHTVTCVIPSVRRKADFIPVRDDVERRRRLIDAYRKFHASLPDSQSLARTDARVESYRNGQPPTTRNERNR